MPLDLSKYTPKELIGIIPEQPMPIVDRIFAEKSLKHFIMQAWHIVEPKTPLAWNWHLDAIVQHLEAVTNTYLVKSGIAGTESENGFKHEADYSLPPINYLLINIPPRHTKSLIVSVFWPAWEWGAKNLPGIRYIFTSYSQSLSIRDSLKRRRIIESNWYQTNWGHRFSITTDQNQKQRFDNDRTGSMISTSFLGVALGEGGDRIVSDDPNNTLEIESEVKCQKAISVWDDTYSTRLNDDAVGAFITIQQRTGVNDISGHLIKKYEDREIPNLVHLCLPARYEKDHPHPSNTPLDFKDPRTVEGEPLDKNRWPDEKLKIREGKLSAWARTGQFQQRPKQKGGALVKTAQIKIVENYNHRLVNKMVRYWDKAACLIAGAMITTNNGLVPIENVEIGDLVLTRDGFQKVENSFVSGFVKQLVSVVFTDGRILTGTHDHPVFTSNRGWASLIDLKGDDLLCQDKDLLLDKKCFFKEKDTLENQMEDTSIATIGTRNKKSISISHCIETFGKTKMAPSPMAIISTIRTKTGTTTTYQILNASPFWIIGGFMQRIYHLRLRWQIKNIARRHLNLFLNAFRNRRLTSVKIAGQNLQQSLLKPNSASHVKKEERQMPKCLSEGVPVYDLTVHKEHEFFANGILVHNSTDRSASFTSSVLMALMKEDSSHYGFVILDVTGGQWTVGERDARMKQTAEMDGIEVQHVVEQEGGSGGKESALNSIKKVFLGYRCKADHPTGEKPIRLDSFAGQVENDNVAMLKGAWNKSYLDSLEACTVAHVTDFGDATSGAFNWLNDLTGKGKSKVRVSVR